MYDSRLGSVLLSSEGDNPLRAMLEVAVQGALECEMADHLAAKPYERSADRQKSFSSQQVSKLARGLDRKITEWRDRQLEGEYSYLIVDARYEKVRSGGGC